MELQKCRNVVLSKTKNISRLDTEGQVFFPCDLNNAMAVDRITMVVDVKTLPGFNARAEGAFVAIWKGAGKHLPDDIEQVVARYDLKDEHGSGEYSSCTLKVTKGGIDLATGVYTIGLFTNGTLSTLAAQCLLVNGTGDMYQGTNVGVSSMSPRHLNITYAVPQLVNPGGRGDGVYLYDADAPIHSGKALAHTIIDNGHWYGTQLMDISKVLLEPQRTYLVQYFPRSWWGTQAASILFKVR